MQGRKNHKTFASWYADQDPKQKRMINALRRLVKKVAPRLKETAKWTNGCWEGEEWPVIFLHAKDDHLQFGFFAGSELSDPKKLLQGSGKHVKHLKVFTLKDIKETDFAKLIRQADRYERS